MGVLTSKVRYLSFEVIFNMRFKLFVLAAVVFIGLAAVSSAFGQTGETLFSGTIDGSKVEFALTRDGESLIGDDY